MIQNYLNFDSKQFFKLLLAFEIKEEFGWLNGNVKRFIEK